MANRHAPVRVASLALVATSLGAILVGTGDPRPSTVDQQPRLPEPPGARTVTLPRGAADKPHETAVAVNPGDNRHVVVSYHQSVGAFTDHHFGMPVEVQVAWSKDGGATWAVAAETSHPGYLRSLDATVTVDRH